jgi:RHS repeat-associated protein
VVTEYLVDTSGPLSQVVVEGPTVGEVGALYVRGDDLLAVVRPAGGGGGGEVVRYPHADGLGSVRALTDEAGAVTDRYDYEAFGQLAAREGTDPQPYLFAGESLDPNSGWYYNRARWMDPSVGRFGSVDPWLGNASDPTSLHRYSYAASDPTNRSDPSGRFSTPELLMTALLVGLFASAFYGIRTALAGGSVGKIAKAEAEWFVRGALIGATVYAVLWGGVVVYVGLATGGVTYSPQVYDAYRAGRAYVVTLDRATTVYRYTGYGGGLAGQSLSGQWWTTVLYSGSGQAIEELALPASNTATYVFSGVVPAGTQILVGEAAPLFGRVGGGVQIYLSGPLAMNFLGTLP